MALITRTYTFVDGTAAYGSQVDSEIQNIVDAVNNLGSSASPWTSLKSTGDVEVTTAGSGFIVTDDILGVRYRIRVSNGNIGVETV